MRWIAVVDEQNIQVAAKVRRPGQRAQRAAEVAEDGWNLFGDRRVPDIGDDPRASPPQHQPIPLIVSFHFDTPLPLNHPYVGNPQRIIQG